MIFTKKTAEDKARSLAKKRLTKVDTDVTLNWAEQAAGTLYKALEECRKELTIDAVGDARHQVSLLAGAIDVLEARTLVSTDR